MESVRVCVCVCVCVLCTCMERGEWLGLRDGWGAVTDEAADFSRKWCV